jgi:hypothetical protein
MLGNEQGLEAARTVAGYLDTQWAVLGQDGLA